MQKKKESPLILLTICLLLKYILIFFSLIWNSMSINIQIVATLENSFEIPREIKHRITIWPNKSSPVYITSMLKTGIWMKICMQIFTAALFIADKVWKPHKCPSMDEQRNKLVYTYNEVLFSNTKEWSMDNKLQCTWILKTLC